MVPPLDAIQKSANFINKPIFQTPLHGGSINKVYLIEADNNYWVVKQNSASRFPEMLEKEFRAVKYLYKNSPLRYPKMRNHFTQGNQQFLIMEYIEEGANSPHSQELLGRRLAQQHRVTNDYFGWEEDNYIGSLGQVNELVEDWIAFFIAYRLAPQMKIAFDAHLLNLQDVQHFDRLFNQLKKIIPEEPPSLLHGDLWRGNYFISKEKEPILFDPAIYFGHREMDVSMTKLFGGFSSTFYRAYQQEFLLEKDWEKRVPLFQLYPNLVHLNLFGTSYLSSIRSVIAQF